MSLETADELAGIRGTSDDDPSGALRAQEAHDAGAVVAPVELPTFDVRLELRVHARREEAHDLAVALVEKLVDHPLVVPPVTFTVAERA